MIRAVLAALLLAGPATAACKAPGEPDLAGLYQLEGVFEVGSEFMLYPDGRFEFYLAYGAIDQVGEGCWSTEQKGWVILLPKGRNRAPTVTTPADRKFRGMNLVRERDGSLRWQLPGEQAHYRKVRG